MQLSLNEGKGCSISMKSSVSTTSEVERSSNVLLVPMGAWYKSSGLKLWDLEENDCWAFQTFHWEEISSLWQVQLVDNLTSRHLDPNSLLILVCQHEMKAQFSSHFQIFTWNNWGALDEEKCSKKYRQCHISWRTSLSKLQALWSGWQRLTSPKNCDKKSTVKTPKVWNLNSAEEASLFVGFRTAGMGEKGRRSGHQNIACTTVKKPGNFWSKDHPWHG